MFAKRLKLKLKKRNMTIEDYTQFIIKEMFNRIGKLDEYDISIVTTEEWFMTHEWNVTQQNSYIDWFIKDLRSMKCTKRDSIKFAAHFVAQYGWKLIKDEEIDG